MTARDLRLGALAAWLLACAILLFIAWPHILTLEMLDADDYLRLQQVRDWLGGQSFFDVAQYRIDPPHGVAMHWSRIVDLPLAGLILALEPLLGAGLAERVTAAIVPLITLGGSMIALALIGVRLAGARAALIAVMLAAATPLLLFHVMPLRIDHHGWQTMLGLFAVAGCFDPKPRRGGLTAGFSAALWLAISLEGLPMVAVIAGLLALRFAVEGEKRGAADRFGAYSLALAAGNILLFDGFRGLGAWSQMHCDAIGPAWIGPLMFAPMLAALGTLWAARRGWAVRLGMLALAGGAGVALLAATAPDCLGGPFATLDPVVRKLWYENIVEGLPVWRQPIANATLLIGFPPIGMAGALLGWRNAASVESRRDWLVMLALMVAAYAVALLVQRAGGLAHGCALPGAGYLLAQLLDRIGGWRLAPLRILASAILIMALSPVGAMMAADLVTDLVVDQPARRGAAGPSACRAPCDRFGAIARLPRSYILTGLDITPRLLVLTSHSYAGSSHHRDQAAIRRVIDAFTGPPEAAHRIMARHGMDYVLIEPGGNEATIYRKAAPRGLMADLLKGKAPAWLKPVPLGKSDLRLWRRIVPPRHGEGDRR